MKKLILTSFLTALLYSLHAQIIISEIHYNPADEGAILGDNLEFIEITNTGTSTINLAGYSFTQGIIYAFGSGSSINAGQSLVIAKNKLVFDSFYTTKAFGQYTGGLKNSIETITLVDALQNTIYEVTYTDFSPWPVLADGLGSSLELVNPSLPNDASSWVASTDRGGSPSTYSSTQKSVIFPIVVNEVLANTSINQTEMIELFNTSDSTINIGFWYLTDDKKDPKKYQFPENTRLAGGAYLVISGNDFNTFFNLSSKGEEVYLFSGDANGLTGYSNGFSFNVSEVDQSFGRHITSQNWQEFFVQTTTTFGSQNSAPEVGPLVFTDIMYNPDLFTNEFLIIKNISDTVVSSNSPFLSDSNGIRINAIGFQFDFTKPTSFAPGESFILTEIAPSTFRSTYGISPTVQIFQYTIGTLSNSNELLQIEIPIYRDTLADNSYDNHYKIMDEVNYFDTAPWPTNADGGGFYLKRNNYSIYANDPELWQEVNYPVLGLKNSNSLDLMYVYPTISETLFHVIGASNYTNYAILDIHGNSIQKGELQESIDAKDLKEGNYIIQLIGLNEVRAFKVIKN